MTETALGSGTKGAMGRPHLTRHELQEIQRRNELARKRRSEAAQVQPMEVIIPKPAREAVPEVTFRALLFEFWDEYGVVISTVLVKSAWIFGMIFEMWREGIFK